MKKKKKKWLNIFFKKVWVTLFLFTRILKVVFYNIREVEQKKMGLHDQNPLGA